MCSVKAWCYNWAISRALINRQLWPWWKPKRKWHGDGADLFFSFSAPDFPRNLTWNGRSKSCQCYCLKKNKSTTIFHGIYSIEIRQSLWTFWRHFRTKQKSQILYLNVLLDWFKGFLTKQDCIFINQIFIGRSHVFQDFQSIFIKTPDI